MRFRIGRRSKPSRKPEASQLPVKGQLPPRTAADDPAFSADPQSHPYHYLTGHEWTVPLAPGHPTIQGPRRRRRTKGTQLDDSNLGESDIELIQPPNTPMPVENNGDGPRSGRHSSQPPPRRSNDPFPTPHMPIAVPPSLAKESKPVKQRFGLLTKRNPFAKQKTDDPAKPLTKTARRSEEHGPPPSQLSEKPSALQRHKTVPQHRPIPVEAEQVEAPSSSYRAVPSTAAINQYTASNTRSQQKRADLDRVDQLDESNLFGTLLHHDGPYEAIRTVVGSNSRMPLGLSDYGRLHQYHERTMKAVGHVNIRFAR
jgi:hypothetical protein